MRLPNCLAYGVALGAIVGSTNAGAQATEPAWWSRRVLLVSHAFEDAATQRMLVAIEKAGIEPALLALVGQKDIAANLVAAIPFPSDWSTADLRALCKLVRARRFVAASLPPIAPDSLRLVIGGAGCATSVDSTTLSRSTPPREIAEHLASRIERLPR